MPHPGWTDFSFDGIGTRWEISTPSPLSGALRRRLLDAVADYDAAWSRFRPDSADCGRRAAAGALHPAAPGHPTWGSSTQPCTGSAAGR